ncbi:MAG: two-component regulator propeller domain-containing protein [Bacteroidales bacterium]
MNYLKTIYRLLLCVICLLLSTYLPAQYAGNTPEEFIKNKEGRFMNFSEADGLSSNLVLNILQDKYGFMWFATERGLTRYDGSHFKTFRHNTNDSTSLSHNMVTALAEDCYGNLWVGTKNGLNIFIRETNCFQRVSVNAKYPHIRALHADKAGFLWIECAGNYLIKYNITSKKWSGIPRPTGYPEGDYYYFHLFEDTKGTLWIGGRTIVPQAVTNKERLQINQVLHSSILGYEAACYGQTADGRLICSDHNGRVSEYDPSGHIFQTILQIPTSATCSSSDKEGNIWIGGSSGLVKLEFNRHNLPFHDKTPKKIHHFTNRPEEPSSLASNAIFCIYTDKDNNIWIGSDRGVSLYSRLQNSIRQWYKENKYQLPDGSQIQPVGYNNLSSNHITSLMQDSDGLLWIGTGDNGVDTLNLTYGKTGNIKYSLLSKKLDASTLKRESYTLKQYKLHEFDKKNVNENIVTALYEDSKGKIYIGLYSHVGFNIYDKKKKVLNRYALWSEKPTIRYPMLFEGNLFGSNWYVDFLEDSYGRFWCATWEGFGLNLFDRQKREFLGKNYIHGIIPRLHTASIHSAYKDSVLNRIYIGGGKYYGYYDLKEKKFHRYAEKISKQHISNEILERYYNESGAILLEMPTGLLGSYITTDGKGNSYIIGAPYILKHNTKDNSVKIIKKVDNYVDKPICCGNHIYFNASYFDIYRICTETDRVEALSRTCVNFNIIAKKIKCHNPLPNGDLWIGTTNGLFYYSAQQKKVQKATIQGYNCGEDILDITANRAGTIYVCTNNGLSIIKENKQIAGLLKNEPINYAYPNNNKLYVCTGNGFVVIDQNSQVSRYCNNPLNPSSLSSNQTLYTYRIDDSTLFVSNTKGLEIFNENTKRFYLVSDKDEYTISSRLASCAMEDSNGHIWYGTTEDGVNIIDMKTDKVRKYGCYTWDPNSLPDNNITCLKEDKAKNIWIGTAGGLYGIAQKDIPQFDTASIFSRITDTAAFYRYNKESIGKRIKPFAGIGICRIEEDKKGRLWISSNAGLFCYTPPADIRDTARHGSLKVFHQYLGFLANQYSNASVLLQDGSLAFGSKNGVNMFHPDSLLNNITNPPVLVTDFRCGNSVLYADLSGIKSPLKLTYGQNSISFLLSAPNYGFGNFIQYRYRLKGYDKQWNDCKPGETPQYGNIPYGSYLLEIEATNCAQEWYGGYCVRIDIAPPFYLTWWFILLGISFTGVIIYILLKNRKLIREKILLRQILEQRKQELETEVESKNKFFSILAHDLKNPVSDLNFIAKTLYENYENLNKEEQLQYIEMIKSSSDNTSGMLNSILLWALSQRGTITPNLKNTELQPLVEQMIETVKSGAARKGIEIQNKVPAGVIVFTDYNLLSSILRNLLHNAIKFSPPGKEVILHGNISHDTAGNSPDTAGKFLFSVTNSGAGMSRETIGKLFRIDQKINTTGTAGEKGSGLGLIIVNELLGKLNETIYVQSKCNDYTTFTITMKYGKAN